MACAFYRGGYRYCFHATPHHCARHQRCGQSPPQGHPNTTLLGFRVALRRRAGLKINDDACIYVTSWTRFCVWGWLCARLAKRQALAKTVRLAKGSCAPFWQTGSQAGTSHAKTLAKRLAKRLVGQEAGWPRGWLTKRLCQKLGQEVGQEVCQEVGQEAWPRG